MRSLIAGVLLALAGHAAAQSPDLYQTTALTTGRYADAVAPLEGKLRRVSRDETAMLNLAMAYRHLGRTGDAEALYRRVLAQGNAWLGSADGRELWSHDVARQGLALLPAPQRTASR